MTQLYEIKVSLSPNQKKNLSNAYHKRETIVLRLTKDSLSGNDTLYVPQNIVKRLDKNRKLKKGMDIKLAKTNIRKQVGGSLLSTVLNLGRTFVPTIAKTLGLSALAGAASEGASQIVKKISGKGIQTGGFLIPQNKINQLIAYKNLLTTKQKQDILNALQTGSGVHIKPTKVQTGGFLDCEQSLFCSKIPAGGAARKASTIFEPRAASREPRAASSVGGRVSEERKERLPCFHTAFLKPGTLVTECFDWSVYDPMARICHHHLKTCSARQRLPSIELLTARHQTHSFKRSYSHI